MHIKLVSMLGTVVLASLLTAATSDAQTKARPKAPPKKAAPRATPVTPPAPAPAPAPVVDLGSVQITGEVVMPSKINLETAPLPLLEALTTVGGLNNRAGDEVIVSHRPSAGSAPEFITISRQDLEGGTPGANITLRDGDIINVPAVKRYFITGFVKNPGSYPLRVGTTVSQAIILAGGLSEKGSEKGIKINRAPTPEKLHAEKVDAGLNDKVQANDEINIRER